MNIRSIAREAVLVASDYTQALDPVRQYKMQQIASAWIDSFDLAEKDYAGVREIFIEGVRQAVEQYPMQSNLMRFVLAAETVFAANVTAATIAVLNTAWQPVKQTLELDNRLYLDQHDLDPEEVAEWNRKAEEAEDAYVETDDVLGTLHSQPPMFARKPRVDSRIAPTLGAHSG